MQQRLKISNIFEKGHANKNYENIEPWIENNDICATELIALVCAKFAQLPQVRTNELLRKTTSLMIAGDIYTITIEKLA